jgi:prolipoprotein diacylglyceryltransferase
MHPQLFGFRSYTLFATAAVAAGVGTTLWLGVRAGLPWRRFLALQVVLALIGLAGAWGYGLIDSVLHPYLESHVRYGTLRYPGGVIAWLAAFVLLAPRICRPFSLATLGDLASPGIGVAMAIVRVGCFLNGCCYGTVTTLPWGVQFPRSSKAWSAQFLAGLVPFGAQWSLPVHPLEFYFGGWSLAVAAYLLWFLPRRRYEGQVLLLFLALHEGGKAALELLRGPHPLPHLIIPSLAVSLLATAVLLARGTSERSGQPSTSRD